MVKTQEKVVKRKYTKSTDLMIQGDTRVSKPKKFGRGINSTLPHGSFRTDGIFPLQSNLVGGGVGVVGDNYKGKVI